MPDYRAHVTPEAAQNIATWLQEPKYSEYKTELETLIQNEEWDTLNDAFFKVIEFGTAGRRGTTGVGSNRINRVTIGESAQALCEYVASVDKDAQDKGIVIACDTRLSSPELSRVAAEVCAAQGYKTYVFDSFRSTPQLSFTVRHLQAAAGIVISASHNLPMDNGFKAYWSDGGQITSPHDTNILEYAARVQEITRMSYEHALDDGKIIVLDTSYDDEYIATVAEQAMNQERAVSIAYSPLHGAGQTNTLPVLQAAGFTDIICVQQQMTPDGNFPTVANQKPNPQERAANELVVTLMHEKNADIAITNDPDADRLGVMVRRGNDTIYLSGNQTYILAVDYILQTLKRQRALKDSMYIVNTIVTSDMGAALARDAGITCYNSLPVGFKYVGALIKQKEATDEIFLFGGEESYGGLKGDYARDKDGASAALTIAEYAAQLKREGKTLYDRLLELYERYGLYVENMENVDCPGANGFENMKRAMKTLRSDAPKEVGGYPVTAVLDYQTLERRDMLTGEITAIDSTANNTVAIELGAYERRLIVRPSGTEPKMKFYGMWRDETNGASTDSIEEQMQVVSEQLTRLSRELADKLLL